MIFRISKVLADSELYSFLLYSTYVGAKSSVQVVGNRFRSKTYETLFLFVVGLILQPSTGDFNDIEHAMLLGGNVGTQFSIGGAGTGGTAVSVNNVWINKDTTPSATYSLDVAGADTRTVCVKQT